MEAAVGESAAEACVEEQEQERDVDAFGSETVGITSAIALEKSVTFQLAEIVTELVQSVGLGGKLECSDDDLVNLFGSPAADGVASVQQHLQ